MEKLIDAKKIAKVRKKMSDFYGRGENVNDSRVQKFVYNNEDTARHLWMLDLFGLKCNEFFKTKGQIPTETDIQQCLFFGLDLFMSSLDNNTRKGLMEYVNSGEGRDNMTMTFDAKYILTERYDENGKKVR